MTAEGWDTLVLGAGVLGCATAYHVQRADPDRSVLLLDRSDRPAQGNTRRSVALFRDLFTSPTNRDLACSTIAFLDHVEGELGHRLGLERYGYYWMMDGSRLRSLEGPLRDLEGRGVSLEVHDGSGVRRMLGDAVALEPPPPSGRGRLAPVEGAVLAGNAGTLSPTRLARWYEAEFRSLGGRAEYGFRVDRLVPRSAEGGPPRVWQEARVGCVEGPSGRRSASELVVAAGAWTPSLLDPLGVDCHVKPRTRQAFGLVGEVADRLHGANGFPGGRLPVLVLPSAGVYLKPIRSQRMLLAGCADEVGRPYRLEEDPQPEGDFLDEHILPVAGAYLPGLGDAVAKVSWAGQYHCNTSDGNPYVFRWSNMTVVAGASGSGIMKSDAIGRVASAVHAGEEEARLFDGRTMAVADLGVTSRSVEPEGLVI